MVQIGKIIRLAEDKLERLILSKNVIPIKEIVHIS
jgi:hypothetical protein